MLITLEWFYFYILTFPCPYDLIFRLKNSKNIHVDKLFLKKKNRNFVILFLSLHLFRGMFVIYTTLNINCS